MTKNKIIAVFLLLSILFPFAVLGDREEERKALESELKELEALILQYNKDITKTEAEKQTLQYQISNLRRRIDQLNLQIRQSNLTIQNLGLKIKDTEESIVTTSVKIGDLEDKLVNILRTIYEEDKKSYIEILLSGNNLSDFFDNVLYLEILNLKNKEILKDIKNLKAALEGQKVTLDSEKTDLEKVVQLHDLQRRESEAARRAQEEFLKMTEAQYQQYLKEREELEKKAAEIRARIFELAGTPTTEAPTFGEAYEIAKWVEGITGVRPAFLLAVLHQESGIGRNVGQCYLKNPTTADGINIQTGASVGAVMKPMGLPGRKGDVDDFLIITRELGLDPFTTPVSCPIPSVGGYGGAMGPAQFIPTTWAAYRTRLQNILGRPASPWNIRDSFLASGLYLSNFGANARTKEGEWCAAQAYFTGIRCNPNHTFYGNNVIYIADGFQRDIDILNR